MNEELKTAMDVLEKEKNISADTLFDAIESALVIACKNNFGRTDNVKVEVDRDTFDYHVWAEKTIVATPEEVKDPQYQISLADARDQHIDGEVGDVVKVDFNSKSFGRIATSIAKNVILQKIREEERNAVYNYFSQRVRTVVTGVVQRQVSQGWTVSLGNQEGSFRADGILSEKEQVPTERLHTNDRIKVYILDVRKNQKGSTRILLSRTHPDLVKGLFAEEVAEIRDGTVTIESIAREPGSRTKIAVWSSNPNVDPVGACVGLNGNRVNNVVSELNGEKIDIVNWDENPGNFIQNALSPAKIVAVFADPEEKSAKVVVPDYQLSLAIGREGQNARLAARLTGYKIDIKDETHAKDAPGFRYEDYIDNGEDEDEEEPLYVDEDGFAVDAEGNPIYDEEGNRVVYEQEDDEEADEDAAGYDTDENSEENPEDNGADENGGETREEEESAEDTGTDAAGVDSADGTDDAASEESGDPENQ